MSASILRTKLFRPSLRPRLVARERLFERLDALLHRRLGLVCAPAGYGKTTLVAAWLQRVTTRADEKRVHIAWVSLDEGDDDPAQFMAYLLAALQGVYGAIGTGVQSALTVRPLPPLEPLMVALLNELATQETVCILVLDDYHLIRDRAIHGAVTFLLDHLPPCLHLLLSTRREPPLDLDRMRVHGHLVELRRADLAFSRPETVAFLGDVMDLSLAAEQVDTLMGRTEGWAAGLQLAALSLRGHNESERATRVAAFAGTHRRVASFLLGEVFSRQSGRVRRFLLRTSVLERLCGPLCDALLGDDGAQGVLDLLESSNVFLVPLDEERRWYRYHHLFRDYLRHRLNAETPEVIPGLHRRVSRWCEGAGLLEEATEHALACDDDARAARLVAAMAPELANLREHGRLIGWVERLSDEHRLAHSRLMLHYAYALLCTDCQQQASAVLLRVEGAAARDPSIAARRAAHRGLMALYAGEHQEAIGMAETAIAIADQGALDEMAIETKAAALTVLGLCCRELRDAISARQHFADALDLYERTKNLAGTASALSEMAIECRNHGQLYAAAEHCRQGLRQAKQWASRHGQTVEPLQVTYPLHMQLVELHYWWNDLEEAERHVALAVEAIELGQFMEKRWVYVGVAALAQARGDLVGARHALVKVDAMAYPSESVRWRICAFTMRCRAMIARSHPNTEDIRSQVAAWVDAQPLLEHQGIDEPDRLVQWALAHGMVALGRYREALSLVVPLCRSALALGLEHMGISVLVLESLARWALGQADEGLDALGRALVLAQDEGWIRVFVDEGPAMEALLKRFRVARMGSHMPPGAGNAVSRTYVDRLLAAFPARARVLAVAIGMSDAANDCLYEPLTPRENDVLRLLAEGLTNRRIAERLFVSAHTVGFHTRNIYGKLGVHTRGEAVAAARRMGLI